MNSFFGPILPSVKKIFDEQDWSHFQFCNLNCGIGWLVGGSFMGETFLTINVTVWSIQLSLNVLLVMDCVTAWCSSQVQPTNITLAHQWVLSSSEVRASNLEHGGLWVQIPSGAQNFSVSSWLILYISLYFLYNINIGGIGNLNSLKKLHLPIGWVKNKICKIHTATPSNLMAYPLLILFREELLEKYEGKITQEMTGPIYEIVSRLMKAVIGRRITVPGTFKRYQM